MARINYFNFAKSLIIDIGKKLLVIYEKLYSNIPSTLWISDLHGDGERFIRVLQGRFGMLYTTVQEALKTEDAALIRSLTKLIRRKYWSDDLKLSKEESLIHILKILRYKVNSPNELDIKFINYEFATSLLKTTLDDKIPDVLLSNQELFDFSIKDISDAILVSIPEHIIVLGDIFDRGSSPDKILRILKFPYYRRKLSIIWGNHDILWLGALAGNKSLVAEALRISFRYGHTNFLSRIGLDLTALEKFATSTYPVVQGNFKAKLDHHRSIEKALAIIQFKLEEKCIKANPLYEMQNRLWLDKLAKMLAENKIEALTDNDFPTIDLKDPNHLSTAEENLINDLTKQFINSRKLARLLELFITEGRVYKVYQNFLNIHALIPSTERGEYETLFGYKGRELLDYLGKLINRVGQRCLQKETQDHDDLNKLFYLWCGPKSPLFGKDAMKTFERYFIKDKSSHKEKTLHWNDNLVNKKFQELLINDFQIDKLVFGHTPRDIKKGDTMSTAGGFAVNIDGGFSGSYLERGHAMVRTAYSLYGIVLPTAEAVSKVIDDHQSVPALIEPIAKRVKPLLFADIHESDALKREESELLEELRDTTKKSAAALFQIDDGL